MNQIDQLLKRIDKLYDQKIFDERNLGIMKDFASSYMENSLKGGASIERVREILNIYLDRLEYLHHNPFTFESHHKIVSEPFDYFQFGLDFVRPIVNQKISEYRGKENLDQIYKQLEQNHNVILVANHQTEVDPQFISLLLEKEYPKLAKDMIFVAGDRVIMDQLAIPASMGRNLLCIYSKKHIHNPPGLMEKKRLHNKRTMELMSELLKEGGKCIYVAPSGGRDRPNEKGEFPISPIDPQSIELFYIMAQRAKAPFHFNSLSLLTHRVLPPPKEVSIELGEERTTEYAPIYAHFGNEIDMLNFLNHPIENKIERRHLRADFIWNQINEDYQDLIKIQDQHEHNT